MRQILPQLIIDNYKAGIYRGELMATGLFIDISGFSTMADTLMQHGEHGAEVLAWIMRQVFNELTNQVLSQGGFIVGFAGDAVTAFFKDEQDPRSGMRRALAAAWGFQQALARQPKIDTIYGTFPISAKAGLAHGLAVWGIVPSKNKLRASNYFSGEPVNGSADAEHRAQPGEIILSADIFESLSSEIACTEVEHFYRLDHLIEAIPNPQPVILNEPDPEVLRVFFPDILLKTNVPMEFRQVINLFIQLADSSLQALEEFIEDLFEIQTRYGGLISRIDQGDKGSNLLMFWGAPLAFENDIQRSLHFISELRAEGKQTFRAGLTYYISCAGFMGSDQREEYTCYGRGINLAARFMTEAGYGEIWLDARIASRSQKLFELEDIGERPFKGFARQERVFKLLQSKSQTSISYEGKMVGREQELERLAQFVNPLWDGQFAEGLVIWGEAGMGKSRLVGEFRASELFQKHQARWAQCQSDPLQRKSFNAFRYWLRQFFNTSPTLKDQENLARFHDRMQRVIAVTADEKLQSELEISSSFLAALVDLHWENSLFEQLDAQGRYDNTFRALSTLIKAGSRYQPLIIVIEDAQDTDPDSQAFLAYLNRSLRAGDQPYPVAILVTSRKDETNSLNQELFSQEINLGEISPETMTRLAETILGGEIAPSLQYLLMKRAEGNPFFAEQILSYMREERLLQMGADGWEVNPSGSDFSLPVDIHAILVARLDQLTREVRDVIQTASILGREFEVQVLSQMLNKDANLSLALSQAEQASIWTALTEIRYIFHHALLRDAAYGMQMQARREELHKMAVEALENVFAGHLRPHFAELAYHAEHGNLIEKARRYLKLAGDASRETYEDNLAVEFYTRALTLTPEYDKLAQFSLLLDRERVYGYQRKTDLQLQDLKILQEMESGFDIGLQAEVGLRAAKYFYNSGDFRTALSKIDPLLPLAQASNRLDILTQVKMYEAACHHRLGDFKQAIRQYRKALSIARMNGDNKAYGQLLNTTGLVYLELREYGKARQYFKKCLKIAGQFNMLRAKASVLNHLGMLASYSSDFYVAQTYFEQSKTLFHECGDRSGEINALNNLGWLNGMVGENAKARDYLQQTIRLARESGNRYIEAYGLINLSAQNGMLGELENAVSNARQGLGIAQSIGDQSGEAWAWTYLAHNLMNAGSLEEAIQAYQAAITIREKLSQFSLATEPIAGLARANQLSGNSALAQRQADIILAHLDGGNDFEGTDEPIRILLNIYYVLKEVNHPRSKEILEIGHKSLQQRLSNIKDDAARTTFLKNISYNHELLAAWEHDLC